MTDNFIIKRFQKMLESPRLYFLSAVSVSTKSKLKDLLNNEAIVNDVSAFDSFSKALDACNKYVKDFCNAGYAISHAHVDKDYTVFVLHKGSEIEQIEITNRELNYDICDTFYFEDEEEGAE